VVTTENIPVDLLEVSKPIDAIIDVGAHFGIYSVVLKALNPDTELYAFEPDDENRRVAEDLLSENNIIGKVSGEVITEKTGTVSIYIDRMAHSQSHAMTPKKEGDFQTIEKPSLALSDLVSREDLDRIFVKIDAEGEEMAILQDLFKSSLSYIEGVVELHPDKLDVAKSDVVDLISRECNRYEFVAETAPDYKHSRPMYYFNHTPRSSE
jgi:FkbM family methyltransferase